MQSILPEKHHRKILESLILPALDVLMKDGEVCHQYFLGINLLCEELVFLTACLFMNERFFRSVMLF